MSFSSSVENVTSFPRPLQRLEKCVNTSKFCKNKLVIKQINTFSNILKIVQFSPMFLLLVSFSDFRLSRHKLHYQFYFHFILTLFEASDLYLCIVSTLVFVFVRLVFEFLIDGPLSFFFALYAK